MARQWRIEYPGALYHVLSRGNDGQGIFHSNDDRQLFLDLIGKFSDRFHIEVFAYVLMDNHYHLLLKTLNGNLSKSMQWLGTVYTLKINNKYEKSGHLFQGRFKSIIVENDQSMLRLSCYIHRNPLRAGLVTRLFDYPWSSYRFYGYGQKGPNWLKTGLILGLMEGRDPHQQYRNLVQQYSDEKVSLWEDVQHGLIFGSQDFATDIRERFISNRKEPELPQYNSLFRNISIDKMIQQAELVLGFNLRKATQKRRIPVSEKDKRDMILYFLWETGRLTNQEIGAYFGLTYSSVSRRVYETEERLQKEKGLHNKLVSLKSQVKVWL